MSDFYLIPSEFKEVNVRIGESQANYRTLPCYFNNKDGSLTFKYELSDEQIEMIVKNKAIWFQQFVGESNFQPVRASTEKSDIVNNTNHEGLPMILIIYSSKVATARDYIFQCMDGKPFSVIPVTKDMLGIPVENDMPFIIIEHRITRGFLDPLIETFVMTHQRPQRTIIIDTNESDFVMAGCTRVDLDLGKVEVYD